MCVLSSGPHPDTQVLNLNRMMTCCPPALRVHVPPSDDAAAAQPLTAGIDAEAAELYESHPQLMHDRNLQIINVTETGPANLVIQHGQIPAPKGMPGMLGHGRRVMTVNTSGVGYAFAGPHPMNTSDYPATPTPGPNYPPTGNRTSAGRLSYHDFEEADMLGGLNLPAELAPLHSPVVSSHGSPEKHFYEGSNRTSRPELSAADQRLGACGCLASAAAWLCAKLRRCVQCLGCLCRHLHTTPF